jgi:hypothetical protein
MGHMHVCQYCTTSTLVGVPPSGPVVVVVHVAVVQSMRAQAKLVPWPRGAHCAVCIL